MATKSRNEVLADQFEVSTAQLRFPALRLAHKALQCRTSLHFLGAGCEATVATVLRAANFSYVFDFPARLLPFIPV